jgi:ketosteroid isomerase-like protein
LCKREADPDRYDADMMIETATDDATLTRLNRQYVDSFLYSDVEWYRQHVTDDFVCIESDGTMLDKASFLLDTAKGPGTVADYQLVNVRVRILGDTAFIHAQGLATRHDGTQIHSRYTDVWVRVRGEWKAASAQITRIAS